MLFNSIEFALFLPVVFLLYWFVFHKSIRYQNTLILIASYFFYGWWNWRFLLLILLSTLIDYIIGLSLENEEDDVKRKFLLFTSIGVNIGLLGVFKYYNFFAESFAAAFSLFGTPFDPIRLNIILPIGISFYTFQTLSYSIDIYWRKLEATRDFISFAAFVSFFPQLVAGPVERAKNLLPQFHKNRVFDYHNATNGLRQILWGLFKKIVIADNCAVYANLTFDNTMDYSGSTLALGAVLFAFQIYCDFSGYSDIAIGTAKLFGFKLMQNFAYPHFSRDIAEFWRRWHISLSTWFRDYLYIPMGGSRVSKVKRIRNVFIIFIIGGFWHGADIKFLAYGSLHALYILPLIILGKNRKNLDVVAYGKFLPSIRDVFDMGTTFCLRVFALIIFRAASIEDAFIFMSRLFTKELFSLPSIEVQNESSLVLYSLILIFNLIEWVHRDKEFALSNLNLHIVLRWSFYIIIILLICFYKSPTSENFIYFQF